MALTTPTALPGDPALVRVPLHRFVAIAGAVCMLVAALVLLGWAVDSNLLKTLLPGHAAMKANTAVCLLFAGLALVTSREGRPTARTVSLVLSVFVLLLGAATLVQYLEGVDFHIDTLLFDDPDSLREGREPGRMSEISSVAFVLVGWKGIEARNTQRIWLGQVLGLAIVAIGLFALSAYGYAMGTGSPEAPFNPISVHTAVMLLLLGLGWLATQPGSGVMRVLSAPTFGGELARRTLLPALLIPAILSYGAQMLRHTQVLSDGAIITLLAVSSGAAVATMIWWASALLDRVENQRRVTHHLRDTANTDALTGLRNRRAFDDALRRLLGDHAGGGTGFALLLLDLDHFKSYNDSFGHPAGDEALRAVARALAAECVQLGATLARYGGEEFVALLSQSSPQDAVTAAHRMRERVFSMALSHPKASTSSVVTISAGVAACVVSSEWSGEELVKAADEALYKAKAAGRNRVAVAESLRVQVRRVD